MQKSSTIWRLGSLIAVLVLAAGIHAADAIGEAEQEFLYKNMNAEEKAAAGEAIKAYIKDHGRDNMDAAQQAGFEAIKKRQVARGVSMPGTEPVKPPAVAAPAAPAGENAAKVQAFTDQKAQLDAAGVAYKTALVDAWLVAYGKQMDFLASLNLNDLDVKLPADPRASDVQRRDQARNLNQYFATQRLKLNDWKQQKENPKLMEMYRKSLMGVTEMPLDVTRAAYMLPEFFDLYRDLKIENPMPEAKPVEEPGVIDNAPWRQKK